MSAVARPATPLRDEFRALAALAGPLVGANLLQMAVYAVDVVFVARLGTIDFAAATLSVFLFTLCFYALIGMAAACAPLIAAERGRRLHAVRDIRRSFRMAMWLAFMVGVPLMVLLGQGEAILRAAGQNPLVAARAGLFLHIVLWAMLPNIAAGVMRTAAAALGRPGWALGVAICALGVGATSNWVLIYGHWGVPALGLAGSAWAGVITAVAMMFAYAAILVLDPRLRRYRLFGRWWRPEWRRLGDLVKLGTPIALSFTMEGALFGGAAVLMGWISPMAVAAHAVALNIAALTYQVPLGIGQAATIRVGLGYGAQDRAAIARAGWAAMATGSAVMFIFAAAMWLVPYRLISLYLDPASPRDAATAALAARFLAVAALLQLFDGAQVVTAGALRGVQDARVPMLIAAFGYWVAGFGTALLLGFRLGWGGVGIWSGLAMGLAFVAGLLLWRWATRGRWMRGELAAG